jgi:hypothetical protein
MVMSLKDVQERKFFLKFYWRQIFGVFQYPDPFWGPHSLQFCEYLTLFTVDKRAGREDDYSRIMPLLRTRGAMPLLAQNVFIARCLIRRTDPFTCLPLR